MHSALAIANTIVETAPGRTPMGLNKLVYLVQGWTLAVGRPLVCGLPEVWRYGPVYPDVYEAFRAFGHVPPNRPQPIPNGISVPVVPASDARARQDIAQVLETYRDIDELGLSSIAHAEGSPWKIVAASEGYRVKKGTTIPESLINAHFARLLSESQPRQAA